ncbi:hypothetical protein WJX74_007128 [Apatococcus lobatus]|uniref:Non-structural maintenance of chromosomes element 1 homolog n=1 Tax=Apatococcus lobatus TaxID=904363 RepID=A0AAW1RNT6_9CHLO
MARGYFAQAEAQDMFHRILGSNPGIGFGEFIGALNLSMEFLQLQLRQIKCPGDSQTYVGFVNKAADEPAKAGTRLSITQNNYFRALLESIASREDAEGGPGYISSMEALNTSISQPSQASQAAGTQVRASKLTLQEKNDTLDTLVNQGWLAHAPQSSNGYTIGPRSFLELQEFLLSLDLPDATRRAWQDVLVRIGLNLKQIPYECVTKQANDPELAAQNPQSKVPYLLTEDQQLSQSLAILEWLEESYPERHALLPKDPAGRARVRSIAQLVCCDVQPLQNTVLAEYPPPSFDSKDFSIFWVRRHLPKIEAMLSSPEAGDFCHGQAPSMADACLVPQVWNCLNPRLGCMDMTQYPNTWRIYSNCLKGAAFQQALPDQQEGYSGQ